MDNQSKIYVKSVEDLRFRAAALKEELDKELNVVHSDEFVYDLVAKSLKWKTWKLLCLGHENPGVIFARKNTLGRWFDAEVDNNEASKELSMQLALNVKAISLDCLICSLNIVWPKSISKFSDNFRENGKKSVLEIPDYYLRDNILIDVEDKKAYEYFLKKQTLPFISRNGGIIFCGPEQLDGISHFFNERNEKYRILADREHQVSLEKSAALKNGELSHLTLAHKEDNFTLCVFESLLMQYAGNEISNSDMSKYLEWLKSEINIDDDLCFDSLKPGRCNSISETSVKAIVGIIHKIYKSQISGEGVVLNQLFESETPTIVVAKTDSFLGHIVLSSFVQMLSRKRQSVMDFKSEIDIEKSPRLLVFGADEQLTLNGFGISSALSSAADWSIVIPKYNKRLFGGDFIGTEMPGLIANIANIFKIKKKPLGGFAFGSCDVDWYCLRNTDGDLFETIRSFSDYTKSSNVDDLVLPIKIDLEKAQATPF